jgi:PGM1 C-terminal domain
MLPKPPFPCDLSLDEELAAFEALKPRLRDVWNAIITREDSHCTSVVVPSLTLDQEELRKLTGAAFYEERLLFTLIRLRNPRAHVVYVTSQPVHPMVLEYYLHLLAGVPASHARARLTMLCCYDQSSRPLTQKILERPRLIQRIRQAIMDPSRAYLTVFNSTPLERKLAVLLGIPLNGLDPALSYLGTKSGSRKVFREAGIDLPAGYEDLHTEEDIERALADLRKQRPAIRKAIIKLNDSFSGEGNAVFKYPASTDPGALTEALANVAMPVEGETRWHYFEKFRRMGGIVEEFVDAPIKTSPSAQFRTGPSGEVLPISTHDQILGGASGQIYLGCTFPADEGYRFRIQEAGRRVGQVLAKHGVVSRYGVDFLAFKNRPEDSWEFVALEINLRVVGTTHPFLALTFLTGGHLDQQTGLYMSLGGRAKYYQATDNLRADRYRSIVPDDLIDITTLHGLHYSHRTESGALFHMIGAVSEFGKLGVTVIGNSPPEVADLYGQTLRVLDAETVVGTVPSGPASTSDW